MNEEKKLEKEAAALNARLWEIRSKREDEENRKHIGKCYRFRNSYGHGENWWLYLKVLGCIDGRLSVISFQECSHGILTIEPDKCKSSLSHGYEEIPEDDFNTARHDFLSKVQKYLA